MKTDVKSAERESSTTPRETSESGERRPMREDDLLRFQWDADPRMAPDGARAAFTRVWIDAEADEYRTQIWIAEAGRPARPWTSGRYDTQPRWSPDGQWLAFVRASEAGKPGQIHVMSTAGGEALPLTSLEGGASDPAWSPDGARLAFSSAHHPVLDAPDRKKPKNEPARVIRKPVFRENGRGFYDDQRKDHVWVIERAGGAPRALTVGGFAESGPRWSRDGRWILFTSDRRPEPWFGPEESKLWAVSPDLETPTEGDALMLAVDAPGAVVAWTEGVDGTIAWIGTRFADPRTYDQPGLFVARGPWPRREPIRLAPDFDFPFGEAISSDQHPPRGGGDCPLALGLDGEVVTRVGKHGSALLVEVRGNEVAELTRPLQEVIAGTASADGAHWALTIGTPRSPGDLMRFDRGARSVEMLDRSNPWLDEIALGEIEELWYPSFDGTRIQGWLVKPPRRGEGNGARPPMILEIHGGPHTAYGFGFFHEFHVLAGAGYAVLYTNPRGSTTYGEDFATVIQYRFPEEDAKDLLAGVEEIVARGTVDGERVGVTGGSGGGLLTNWLVVQTSRFKAAVTQRCVSDWAAFYHSADFAMFTPFWFRKPPYEDPEEYRLRSPVAFASRITTPLMVIHSEEDWRTPIAQGEAMFRALKQQRKPTVMIRFPGESHELSRSGAPSRRVQNQEHIRRWFDRWLLEKPAPEYGV
ncbi:MAG: S9 family peptidase [Candidatus Eisenbacteria bacterium]|uniref:S9 family peptidase n=1 Tax=Eiseniibacteriota bacterium TaxID=2212470 RepID=A0A538U483_UNCEI|nr:MAG: S9 family peptidase [Candidatus Eisenbacteria bacterium]